MKGPSDPPSDPPNGFQASPALAASGFVSPVIVPEIRLDPLSVHVQTLDEHPVDVVDHALRAVPHEAHEPFGVDTTDSRSWQEGVGGRTVGSTALGAKSKEPTVDPVSP